MLFGHYICFIGFYKLCIVKKSPKVRARDPLNWSPFPAPVGPGHGGGADLVGGVAASGQHAVSGEQDDVAAAVSGDGLAAPLAVVGPLQLKRRIALTSELPQFLKLQLGISG